MRRTIDSFFFKIFFFCSSDFAVSSTTFRIETLKHNKSRKHILCRDRCVAGKAAPLPAAFQRRAVANQTSENSKLMIKFNTAYNIAKEELPFTKFKSLITLMKKRYGCKPDIRQRHCLCAVRLSDRWHLKKNNTQTNSGIRLHVIYDWWRHWYLYKRVWDSLLPHLAQWETCQHLNWTHGGGACQCKR